MRALLSMQEAVSAREAARLAGVAHPPALRALGDLTTLGVLRRVELSSQHLYTVRHGNHLVRNGLVPLFEAERQRVRAAFHWLVQALGEEIHTEAVRSVAVYGSAARGDDGPGGGFDVLVVTASEAAVPEIHRKLLRLAPELDRELALHLAPLVISRARLQEQITAGDAAPPARSLRRGWSRVSRSISRQRGAEQTDPGVWTEHAPGEGEPSHLDPEPRFS
ncbi:hypothetical protein BH23GEM6_BH23GEM6_24750 [soil metagenome]